MSDTLYVTPAQVLAAKLAIELSEEDGEEPDEALKAIANAEVLTDEQSAGYTQRIAAPVAPDQRPEAAGEISGSEPGRADQDYESDLWARAADGDENAAHQLVEFLVERGRVEGLRMLAAEGDANAAHQLRKLLIALGDFEGLLQLVAEGSVAVLERPEVHLLLLQRGDVEGLRKLASGGDRYAAVFLADVGNSRQRARALYPWLYSYITTRLASVRNVLPEQQVKLGDTADEIPGPGSEPEGGSSPPSPMGATDDLLDRLAQELQGLEVRWPQVARLEELVEARWQGR